MTSALKITDLKKSYGNVEVLKGLSFQVEEGEIFGLLGGNGAGKSTTLECIEGVKSYDHGSIEVFGENIADNKDYHNILGVQLQCTALQTNITVFEAMKFHCLWQGIEVRKDLLDDFGLKLLYEKQYGQLSIGQKRRLHLALSISNNPKILILDEPTAGLDVQGRVELHDAIRTLKKNGVTIILASHDMAEIEMLCDRIAIVVHGEIKFIGTQDEILAEGNNDKRIKIKTADKQIYNFEAFKHSRSCGENEDYMTLVSSDIGKSLKEILEQVEAHNDKIIDLNIEGLSLEEKFVEVTTVESKVS